MAEYTVTQAIETLEKLGPQLKPIQIGQVIGMIEAYADENRRSRELADIVASEIRKQKEV